MHIYRGKDEKGKIKFCTDCNDMMHIFIHRYDSLHYSWYKT